MQPVLQPILTVFASIDDRKIQQMDPQLQRLIIMRRSGIVKQATSSTLEDEVAVIAKVSNPATWQDMTEVRTPALIGAAEADGASIVTGRIPIKLVEHIRQLPFVKSLKAARRIRPVLSATIEETEAGSHLPEDMQAVGGKGCVVGIIDFGCDFAHQNFIKPDNTTRIHSIWNQPGNGASRGVAYGELYREGDINAALGMRTPYQHLGYQPGKNSHGTHVMDIATGNGRGSGVPGMAPEADIIFVELDGSDVPWFGPQVVNGNFGDSVQLLEAMKFIFEEAGDRPCVINASLGTNGGPHDGSTLVEQGIDSLLRQKPNRAVVIAASNSFADNIHAAGTIAKKGVQDLAWIVPNMDATENEMEIWYNGKGRLEVEVIDPSGTSLGVVPPEESGTVKDSAGNVIVFIANRLKDPNNGDNMIGIYLNRGIRGTWAIRLNNIGTVPVDFHAWIERDDPGQSFFGAPNDNSHTLGSISCSHLSLTVGSYDAHRPSVPLSWFSSAGPTRDGRQKPEVSAPGHDVRAAASLSSNGVVPKSGTSMAAPAVTGAVAVLLAEAKSKGLKLTVDQIRSLVINSTRSNPPGGTWDYRYGFGRISVKNMIKRLGTGAPVLAGSVMAAAKSPGKAASGKATPSLPKKASKKPAIPDKKAATKKAAPARKPAGKKVDRSRT